MGAARESEVDWLWDEPSIEGAPPSFEPALRLERNAGRAGKILWRARPVTNEPAQRMDPEPASGRFERSASGFFFRGMIR